MLTLSKRSRIFAVGSVLALALAGPAQAHDTTEADGQMHDNIHLHGGGEDGHVPSNVNYGFELVGWDPLGGVATGRYTDVWAHEGFAYVGTFQEPDCSRAGVYVSDIRDPANPNTVNMIKSPPDTRINDVKVHEIQGKAVLSMTLEPCGPIVGQGRAVGNDTGNQRGKGGISFYDVTNPMQPKALKQNFFDSPTHNVFFWTTESGSYAMAVDDVNLNDVIIVDISKPQSPKLLTITGIGRWLNDGEAPQVAQDGQLFTGSFASPLLHDIWIEKIDGRWIAVLSYWDAGFITLDVTDPAKPEFLGDSTYPDPDPVHGISPAEGNAHAAVFGGTTETGSDLIFGGDEDFDSFETLIFTATDSHAATQGSDVPQIGTGADIESVSGPTVYVGLACSGIDPAPSPDAIAVIQRGDCAFTDKAGSAESAGYQAAIVFNHSTGCEASVSMLVSAGIPALFVPRSSGFEILGISGYDPSTCDGSGTDNGDPLLAAFLGNSGQPVDIMSSFNGWGYLHVLNNTMGDVTVPMKDSDPVTVGYLGEVGYYAPVEVTDAALATGAGDLTMHNLETDPTDRRRSFISWYSAGMRAVEWRPGHLHNNAMGEGTVSWNVHEVGRWIATPEEYGADAEAKYGSEPLTGSNFWGVHVTEISGTQYVLGSDRNTGLHIFAWDCEGPNPDNPALYCNQ